MTTANMGLVEINSSDYVSPNDINANFKTLDALGLDYVVESGKSGEWWYRKWKSGRAECGIDDKNFGTININIPWGSSGEYVSEQLNFGAYPFSFASRPFASIVVNSKSVDYEHTSYISYVSTTSTTTSPKFKIVEPEVGTVEQVHFGIYVCGRYK